MTSAVITLTANPSVDRTLELGSTLVRGEVQRAVSVRAEPGGKGVNVSRVVAAAGVETVAVLPAPTGDPLLRALDRVGLPYRAVPVAGDVRSNITVAEPDGTTTKINAPGEELDAAQAGALADLVLAHAETSAWVALCGSLPPGLSDDWYRGLLDELASMPCRVAVDTSGAPLRAAAQGRADLFKPNDDELAEVTETDPATLKAALAAGDLGPIVTAAAVLGDRTGAAVLATLGATGAILTTPRGSWFATPPPIVPRSTVGAGDSSLAGYVIAALRGDSDPDRLRTAVAYGAAATALAGTQPPSPDHLDPDGVGITEITGAAHIPIR